MLIYADPPYLGNVRGHSDRYGVEMRDEQQHRDLAAALHDCKAAVVLSGYASDLYDRELFLDWDRVEISAFTGNSTGSEDGKRTEVLWSNREISAPDLLSEVTA